MKKLGIIALALVVALGALGVGYAHWQQTLYIEGTVNTGTYCVGFFEASTTDPCVAVCDPGTIGPNPGGNGTIDEGYTKNVGCVNATPVDEKDCCLDNKIAYEKLEIMVCNAYPSYTANITFSLKNCGSIPGEVESLKITKLGTTVVDIELVSGAAYTAVDLTGDGTDDMEIKYVAASPSQIDPCNTTCGYKILLHFLNGGTEENPEGLPQGMTGGNALTFELELATVQWNLATP
jgi:hypothetical protein